MRPREGRPSSAVRRAAIPFAAALLGIGALTLSGATARDLRGTPLEDWAYGFFLDRYPLFFFAALYGAARIVVGAFEPGASARWWRLVSVPAGLILFLAFCFHPTFGGLVLRAGFSAGAQAFLTNNAMTTAYAAGAGAAALTFGLALASGLALARLKVRFSRRALPAVLARVLAIWFGAAMLGLPRLLGWEAGAAWPQRPLAGLGALVTAAIVALALLPHAALCCWLERAGREPPLRPFS